MTGLGRDESCSCVLLIPVGTAGLVPLGSCSKDAPSEALGLQLPPHLPSDCQEGWGTGTEVGHWGGGGTLGAEVGHWEQRWDTGDRGGTLGTELLPPPFGRSFFPPPLVSSWFVQLQTGFLLEYLTVNLSQLWRPRGCSWGMEMNCSAGAWLIL